MVLSSGSNSVMSQHGGPRGNPSRNHVQRPASAKPRGGPPLEASDQERVREFELEFAPNTESSAVDSRLQGQLSILWQRVEDSQRRTDTLFGALSSMDDRFAEARDEALAKIREQGNAAIEKTKEDIVSTAKHFMERTALALQRHWREERVRQQDDSVVELACDQAAARLAEDFKHFETRLTDQVEQECREMRAELERLQSDGAVQTADPNSTTEAQILDKVAMQMQDFEAQISRRLEACEDSPILDKVAMQLQEFEAQISAQLVSLKNPSAAEMLRTEMEAVSGSLPAQQSDEQPAQPQPQEEPEDDDGDIAPRSSEIKREPAAGAGLAAARDRRSREQTLALSLDAQLQATAAQLEATDNRLQSLDARVRAANNRLQDQAGDLKKRADEIKAQTDYLRSAETRMKDTTDQWHKQSKELVDALQQQSQQVQSQAESLQATDSAIEKHETTINSHRSLLTELRNSAQELKRDIRQSEAENVAHRTNEAIELGRMREEFGKKLGDNASTLRAEIRVFRDEVKRDLAKMEEKSLQGISKTSQDMTSLRSDMASLRSHMNEYSKNVELRLADCLEKQGKLTTEMQETKEESFNIARSASGIAIAEVEGRLSDSLYIAKAELDQRQAALEAQINHGLRSVQTEIKEWVNDGSGFSELRQQQTKHEALVSEFRTKIWSDMENLQSSLSALRAEALGEIEAERGNHEKTSESLHALRRDFDSTFGPIVETGAANGGSDQAAESQSIVQKLTKSYLDWRSEMQEVRSRIDEALKGEEWCVETTQASLFVHQQKVEDCLRATSWARQEYDSVTQELQDWLREFRPDQDQIENEFLSKSTLTMNHGSMREAFRDVLTELGSWAKVLHQLLRRQAENRAVDVGQ